MKQTSMETEEAKLIPEFEKKIFQIFSDFMTRTTKFEELVAVGSGFLVHFQQGLDFIRRPSIEKTSKLVECIIKANETKRLLSYIEGGCVNALDSVQNLNKLHTSQLGLWNNLREAKCVVNELECLVEDVRGVMQTASGSLPQLLLKDNDLELDLQTSTCEKEEMLSSDVQKPEVTDYAAAMAVIYSMVKQDYMMQERIVSSLNLKSSSEELESYCMMWSLRPFINDEIMCQSWKLIP